MTTRTVWPVRDPPPRLHEPAKGILCANAAMAIFSTQEVVFKWLSADYDILQLVFIRTWFALIPILWFVWRAGGPRILLSPQYPWLIGRGVIGFCAFYTYFSAIARMPLADVSAITFASPLIITALSVPVLREPVGPHRWGAVVVGFVGVLIVVGPAGDALQFGALLALASAFFYSFSAVIVRALSGREASAVVVFYTSVTFLLASGAAQPFVWVAPAWRDVAIMAITGICGGFAQFLLTQAYRFAPVAIVAPFDYTHLIWATAYGYIFFHDVPGASVLIGAGIVIACGLYIARREALAKSRTAR
ncbi:MAG: DMT family transporter [Alphaproteobacteria bacterium]